MGKHKPLGSSWQAMDTKAYSRSYEPETRPDFHVYITGQAKAWQADYAKAKAKELLDNLF